MIDTQRITTTPYHESLILAHKLAFISAEALVDSYSCSVVEGEEVWMDLTPIDTFWPQPEDFSDELRYLELRGALRRHPTNPMLVQIGEPNA